jgi:hypothetical protein
VDVLLAEVYDLLGCEGMLYYTSFGYVTYGDHGKVLQNFIGSLSGIILMSEAGKRRDKLASSRSSYSRGDSMHQGVLLKNCIYCNMKLVFDSVFHLFCILLSQTWSLGSLNLVFFLYS